MAGPLKNRRREAFAQNLAIGMEVGAAYEAAGYAAGPWSGPNGRKLRQQAAVADRITELQKRAAESCVVGINWVQRELSDIAHGKTPAKTIIDAKGGITQVFDRQAALSALARTLGAGSDVSVSVNASAQASAEIANMSDAELGRRMAWTLRLAAQSAAAATNAPTLTDGDPGDAAPFLPVAPDPPPPLPPPRERAREAVCQVVAVAQDLDLETLGWMNGMLTRALAGIQARLAAAPA